jgi:hypothetical protein
MAKMKKVKMTDEEVLKHYIPCEEPPSDANPPGANDSKPVFTKAVVEIDRIMAGRKTAVIKTNQRNKRKWQKSPTKKH